MDARLFITSYHLEISFVILLVREIESKTIKQQMFHQYETDASPRMKPISGQKSWSGWMLEYLSSILLEPKRRMEDKGKKEREKEREREREREKRGKGKKKMGKESMMLDRWHTTPTKPFVNDPQNGKTILLRLPLASLTLHLVDILPQAMRTQLHKKSNTNITGLKGRNWFRSRDRRKALTEGKNR